MKKILIFNIFYLFFLTHSNSQSLYDNTWIIGDDNFIMSIDWANNGKATVNTLFFKKNKSMPSANDAKGKLLLYSDGFSIFAKGNYEIQNGDSLNPGKIFNQEYYKGSSIQNIGVFLPKPSDSLMYYLFHCARSDKSIHTDVHLLDKFYYTVVDARKETSTKITKKNILLVKDTLSEIGPYACRHANGKDWWVVVPEAKTHGYYSALLRKDGVVTVKHKVFSSNYGREIVDKDGQAVFSPDGSKYIRSDPYNGTHIYDFDRCTGELSNPIFIDTLGTHACAGVAVSPNSKYLYLSNGMVLHQFDLQANDIANSKIKVAEFDGANILFEQGIIFYKMALAPNGKIYMATTIRVDSLHVINKPNEKGSVCDFKKYGFALPSDSYITMPNFPNFNLGAQSGTPCAPLTSISHLEDAVLGFKNFPNPTSDLLNISLSWKFKQLFITDLTGRLLKNISTNDYESEYQTSTLDLENGLYFIQGIREDGKKVVQRFVVQH